MAQPPQTATMPALTGVRFFAVLHIFLFHLWSLYDLDKPEQFSELLIGFRDLPDTLVNFLSHGWLSTSFFFLLSGFVLAYLYWGEDGELRGTKRQFFIARFARIYPVHIILMLISIVLMAGFHLGEGISAGFVVFSALASLTLTQAWFPPAVPMWSWPTWTLSALVFLYLLTPWLMRHLARLQPRQLWGLLIAMPVVSLIPTIVYALISPSGVELSRNWSIFLGSTPVFWLPHFVAGMLLSRLCHITRNHPPQPSRKLFAWGDLALLSVILLACLPNLQEPLKYFLRHGLIMPLYWVVLIDLAKGHGLAARLFSLPGSGFLGETAFSLFIWQNLIMAACWISLMINPNAGVYHLWVAPPALLVIAIISTYCLEKPLARKIRARWGR